MEIEARDLGDRQTLINGRMTKSYSGRVSQSAQREIGFIYAHNSKEVLTIFNSPELVAMNEKTKQQTN